MKPKLKKWRKKTPNQHRSYGEKRNRDLNKVIKINQENDN